MDDALSILLLPFAAAVGFVLIHTWLGVHVLQRRIVFADLALAQLSALGASVAFAAGDTADSGAAFAWALLFTVLGAALLTGLRALGRSVSQEALVGLLYVVATAATVLVVDRSPQGAEHVRQIFVGSILTVGPVEVVQLLAMYAAVGLLHAWLRRPLLAASADAAADAESGRSPWRWDLVFFLSFALVVTSSVRVAGVLLVFSFLIVPALIGTIFTRRLGALLLVGWGCGIVGSALGLGGAYLFDLPTGAAMVGALAVLLLLAGLAKGLWFTPRAAAYRRAALGGSAALALAAILGSSLWLLFRPAADQPLLALLERATGFGAADFMSESDRRIFNEAAGDSVRFQAEFDRLDALEKAARVGAAPLADDEVRRIASYQRSFNEMTRGERFVQDTLRAKARGRERWLIGLPGALLASIGLALLWRGRLR